VQIIGDADNIDDGIHLIRKLNPEMVFLDIEIGEQTGFQLLDQLPAISFQLVFTTAYSEFAIKAFRYHAIDYLLKPIQPNQLIAAVEKAGQSSQTKQIQQQINELRQALSSGQSEKVIVPTMEGLNFIKIESIVHVEGSANYSTFHLNNGDKIMASKNLKYYDDLLPSELFYRVHQSHLVNIRFIKKIIILEGYAVELEEGVSVPLARKRKEELLNLLKGVR
jgi:two-component system LytT family response regulator